MNADESGGHTPWPVCAITIATKIDVHPKRLQKLALAVDNKLMIQERHKEGKRNRRMSHYHEPISNDHS